MTRIHSLVFPLDRHGPIYVLTDQCIWLNNWKSKTDGKEFYRGSWDRTGDDDIVASCVHGMSDEMLIEFKMLFNARVIEGDIGFREHDPERLDR